ncbi:MAG TPA: hypothetical protein VHN55_04365, partial [Sphingomicrobium sp.]|nr:hypothetical protein [Sphingomicrobium sp.]
MAIGRGVSVWVLDAPHGFGAADYHSHHAIQITVALDGQLSLSTSSESLSSPALAVAADALHRIDGCGFFAFIFVEPESRQGRSLSQALFGKRELVELDNPHLVDLLAPLRRTFEQRVGNEELLAVGRSVIEALAPAADAPLPDARVQRII